MSSMDWDDLKVFTAIAHSGSVRAAARRLGIHHSTVARRLDHFEKRLGAVMFNRTPEGLKLSADGQVVLVQAEQVEGRIDDIERVLLGRDQRLQGHVRITFPEPVGTSFLMRDLGRFVADYPDISLDFIDSYEALSLTRGEADVAVRVTDSPPEHLVGRRLGQYAVAVYASAAYLDDARSGRASRVVQLDRLGNGPIDQRSDAPANVSGGGKPYAQPECATATRRRGSRRRYGGVAVCARRRASGVSRASAILLWHRRSGC